MRRLIVTAALLLLPSPADAQRRSTRGEVVAAPSAPPTTAPRTAPATERTMTAFCDSVGRSSIIVNGQVRCSAPRATATGPHRHPGLFALGTLLFLGGYTFAAFQAAIYSQDITYRNSYGTHTLSCGGMNWALLPFIGAAITSAVPTRDSFDTSVSCGGDGLRQYLYPTYAFAIPATILQLMALPLLIYGLHTSPGTSTLEDGRFASGAEYQGGPIPPGAHIETRHRSGTMAFGSLVATLGFIYMFFGSYTPAEKALAVGIQLSGGAIATAGWYWRYRAISYGPAVRERAQWQLVPTAPGTVLGATFSTTF